MNSMILEICSLPSLLKETFQNLDDTIRTKLDHELCLSLKRVFIAGCGDSHNVGVNSELVFHRLAGIPAQALTAMNFARYIAGFLPATGPKTNLVIGISVSGEVSRTVEGLLLARQQGATTLALTGTPGSHVEQVAEITIHAIAPFLPVPDSVHVPGVRSYLVNQVALLLMAIRIGEVRGKLTSAEANKIRGQIKNLAPAIEETISSNDLPAKQLVETWKDAHEFVFIGSGPNYGTALFSAAKILEASGDAAMGQDTEEWCHLQYFAREANTPTIFISAGERDLSRAVETIIAAKKIGRRVAIIAPKNEKSLHDLADISFAYPDGICEILSPMLAAIPGEMIAAYRSELINEPYFRNFEGGRDIVGGGGPSRIRNSEVWEKWQA